MSLETTHPTAPAPPSSQPTSPDRWPLLALAAGPALKDEASAAACLCGCHPSPANLSLHEGGADCPCQWSSDERRARHEQWLADLAEPDAKMEEQRQETARLVSELARELGVTVISCGGMAPFVITGVVDGRFFYLRERHDIYRVAMAPDNDPLADVWKELGKGEVPVASGTYDDLLNDQGAFSELVALRLVVDAVRVALRRRACSHAAPVGSWFCPDCGLRLPAA